MRLRNWMRPRLAAEQVGGNHVSTVTTVNETVGKSSGSSGETYALAAARARLTAAENASEAATNRAFLAQMRLDELEQKGARSAAQLDAAQEAVRAAIARSEDAATRAALAEKALAAAEQKAADKAAELAASQDVVAASTNKAAAANRNNATRMGLIVAAVAALVPMVAALAGYAVGVSGALAGMGVAGVLAILGIKNAIAEGTQVGAVFDAGLQNLKQDLGLLEQTAASNLMGGFQQAISQINTAMPQLNGEIAQFSQMLGPIGNSVLAGVINSFRILNPLFVQAGEYVAGLASGFQAWTQNGGLQTFANYAIQELPLVENTLGSLGAAVMHVLDSLAPLGGVGLSVIKGIADALNLLPNQDLLNLAAGATAGFVAFKLWAGIAPILVGVSKAVGAVGIATQIAEGPIGWMTAAISALGAIVGMSVMSMQDATTAAADYGAALQADNGAIGENMRAQAAKALVDGGATQAAKTLGLSVNAVTDAVIHGGQPLQDLQGKLVSYKQAAQNGQVVTDGLGNAHEVLTDKQIANGKAVDTLSKLIDGNSKSVKTSVQNYKDYTSIMGPAADAASTMAQDLGLTVTQYSNLVSATDNATGAAKTWKSEMDLINGVPQTLEQTNIKIAGDFLSMASSIASAAKTSNQATATSLDINTQYGNANHQMILQAVQDAEAQAAAVTASEIKQGTSVKQAKADGDKALAANRQAIIDHMTAAGLDGTAVQTLVDKILTIPTDPSFTVHANTSDAMAKINTVAATLAALNGSNYSTTVTTFQQVYSLPTASAPVGVLHKANGGTIYKAMGGFADAAYLAMGGSPFVPRGTDTRPAMLTLGEFVVRQPSAAGHGAFLSAFNANPDRALNAVASSGGQNVTVSLAGAVFKATIDGKPITMMIQEQLVSAANQRKSSMLAGRQLGTF